MVFYREPYGFHSTRFLHSAAIGCSSQPRLSGYELGMMHHQPLQSPHPQFLCHHLPHPQFQPHPPSSTQSLDLLDEVMLRQMENESIIHEIIMSEMIRRRALVAAVRYEMMMERAMAIERARNGFPSESPRPMGLDVPMRFPLAETGAERMFLAERTILPPPPRNTLNNWREGGGSEATPFQRAPIDERMPRLSVAEPVLETSSERSKMIWQAKRIINITGAKRASESQPDSNSRKKVKEEWSCALCRVSVDNERCMNKHLSGTKHKRKEAALSARIARKKNSTKAVLNARKAGKKNSWSRKPLSTTNIVTDSMKGSGIADPAINSEVQLMSESLLLGKNGDASSAGDGLPLDMQKTLLLCKNGDASSAGDGLPPLDMQKTLLLCKNGDASSAGDGLPPLDMQETLLLGKNGDASSAGDGLPPLDMQKIYLLGKDGDASSAGDGLPLLDVQETKGDIEVITVDVAELQFSTDKVAESIEGLETSNPATDNEVKLTCKSLPYGNNGDANNFKKKKRKKKSNEPKDMFWCEICQVRMPLIQEALDAHQQGKKHKRRAKLGTTLVQSALPRRR